MRLAGLFVALAACGRIGFDPLGGGGGDGGPGSGGGDALGGDAGSGYAGESCTTAGVIVLGQQLNGQSLAVATNDVSAPSCPNGIDVVYRLSSPAGALRSISINADFGGSVVTSIVCPPSGANCTGFSANNTLNAMTSIPAGTSYVIIEKSTGTGTTFSIRIQ